MLTNVNGWPLRIGAPWAKGFARWMLWAITIAAVGLATVLGGKQYLYCRAMDQIMTQANCDCARTHSDDGDQTAVGALNDCFEVRALGRLVSFTVGSDFAVPEARLVAILPDFAQGPLRANALITGDELPIRAGPRSPAAARALLMVFLI